MPGEDDRERNAKMTPQRATAVLVIASALMVMSPADLIRVNAQVVDGERIAFRSNRAGNFEIYSMNADGSGVTRLTNHSAVDTDPAWSPDGQRIAFTSGRDNNADIYVMNTDGSGLTRLTNHPAADVTPAWSPDGQRIAFVSDRYVTPWGIRVFGIYVMNADGSNVTAPIPPAGDFSPAWSPDGQKISFQSLRDGAQVYPTDDIWVMNVDGAAVTRLTNRDGFDGLAVWSPDGTQIAFNSGGSSGSGIYVMNVDGSGKRFVTAGGRPAWSADGSRIAFDDTRDGGPCCTDGVYNVEVYSVNVDGSGVRRLTVHAAYDQGPTWSR
jgi:Tol biopolymer transport system component